MLLQRHASRFVQLQRLAKPELPVARDELPENLALASRDAHHLGALIPLRDLLQRGAGHFGASSLSGASGACGAVRGRGRSWFGLLGCALCFSDLDELPVCLCEQRAAAAVPVVKARLGKQDNRRLLAIVRSDLAGRFMAIANILQGDKRELGKGK